MSTLYILGTVPEGQHLESTDICYDGGFVDVAQCQDCKQVQDYWSNNSGICKTCGGSIYKIGRGKWDTSKQKWFIRESITKERP